MQPRTPPARGDPAHSLRPHIRDCPVSLRRLLGLLIPLACAALFVRLGFWQLDRHRVRAAANAALQARLEVPPVPLRMLQAADTGALRGRRVTVTGRFRYELEQVATGRVSEGSPGVHLLTPLQPDGSDTLIVVVRGWVYSPDAKSISTQRWREQDSVRISGYLLPMPSARGAVPDDPKRPIRRVTLEALRARIGAPILPVQLIMTSDSSRRADSVPRRLPPPVVEAGPHWSYMWQWFAFAAVAIIGGLGLFRRTGARDASGARAPR